MSSIKCSECGHDVSDQAVSCPHCGAPIPSNAAKVICPGCGTRADSTNTYCPHCGTRLTETAVESETPEGEETVTVTRSEKTALEAQNDGSVAPRKRPRSRKVLIWSITAAAAAVVVIVLAAQAAPGANIDRDEDAGFSVAGEDGAETTTAASAVITPTVAPTTKPSPTPTPVRLSEVDSSDSFGRLSYDVNKAWTKTAGDNYTEYSYPGEYLMVREVGIDPSTLNMEDVSGSLMNSDPGFLTENHIQDLQPVEGVGQGAYQGVGWNGEQFRGSSRSIRTEPDTTLSRATEMQSGKRLCRGGMFSQASH